MTREMGFLIALCLTSTVGYALLARADRVRAERRFARRVPGRESGDAGPSVSSDSWSLTGSSSGSSDSSGNPADFGSCGGSSDSADSGGGDCGSSGGGGTD